MSTKRSTQPNTLRRPFILVLDESPSVGAIRPTVGPRQAAKAGDDGRSKPNLQARPFTESLVIQRYQALLAAIYEYLGQYNTARAVSEKVTLSGDVHFEHSESLMPQTPYEGEEPTPAPRPDIQLWRSVHVGILGKTGAGKSCLLQQMVRCATKHDRGFCFFDLHGDTIPVLRRLLAAEEPKSHFRTKLMVIEPSDAALRRGLNILEGQKTPDFVRVLAAIKQRWRLDSLGKRTEELLRNSLVVLDLDRSYLREQGSLLGTLFLGEFRTAIFLRRHRLSLTLYCDEIQNLVTFDSDLDTLLSEARKFRISFLAANQLLVQHLTAISLAILFSSTGADAVVLGALSYIDAFEKTWRGQDSRFALSVPAPQAASAGSALAQSTTNAPVTDITAATASPISIVGNTGTIGGLRVQSSTVNAPVTDITTATASPIIIIGDNSSAKIGGLSVQNSTVNAPVTDIMTATASPITVIGGSNVCASPRSLIRSSTPSSGSCSPSSLVPIKNHAWTFGHQASAIGTRYFASTDDSLREDQPAARHRRLWLTSDAGDRVRMMNVFAELKRPVKRHGDRESVNGNPCLVEGNLASTRVSSSLGACHAN